MAGTGPAKDSKEVLSLIPLSDGRPVKYQYRSDYLEIKITADSRTPEGVGSGASLCLCALREKNVSLYKESEGAGADNKAGL